MANEFGLPEATTSGYGSTWGTGNGLAATSSGGGSGMWLQAGGALLGGLMASSSQKKQAKTQFKYDWKLQEGAGVISRKNTKFEYELQNYYKQLERKEKMRGLDEYRKFSTVTQFAPNYQNTTPQTPMPTMPVSDQGEYARAGA